MGALAIRLRQKGICKKGFGWQTAQRFKIVSSCIHHAGYAAGIDLKTAKVRVVLQNRVLHITFAARLSVFWGGLAQYRHKLNVRVLLCPLLGKF